ncbi:DegT/DnrJ/EryC1/StrS aminotransferase [Halothece sp. PCC 7418]|uniref:DegT/DnrJ/EryC1/StrS aminotransferase n=1 Tax=Halothece sp. (strain PCC 7418) TaxID=65093 RepID=UPI0002A06C8E|nr:DegT/DnrJ/EryC1/StrS aminotransferase [Halothece sp. PCC 7418]AFZ45135.1 DegT/DnrJ/EryC1/StrS aminotransferase [Halothece sp. PCC 7418]
MNQIYGQPAAMAQIVEIAQENGLNWERKKQTIALASILTRRSRGETGAFGFFHGC